MDWLACMWAPLEMALGGRRCEVYQDNIYHIDYCCAFVIFGIVWPCIELGNYPSNYW